ncbi:MAG TPA: hypothetical protein VK549_02300 [Acidimicrobiia bacterium]|nr:hypothetical protein [Acidimicrobiia bacterium]
MGEPTPAGWYQDPDGLHERRFWDGTAWRDWVADGDRTWSDPPTGEHAPPGPNQVVASAAAVDAAPREDGVPSAPPTRRTWLANALLLIVVAIVVGAATTLVLEAIDDDSDTASTSQLEERNANAKAATPYVDVGALADAAGISCTTSNDGVVSSDTGSIGTTRYCWNPSFAGTLSQTLDLAVVGLGAGPPQTCVFWQQLTTDATALDRALRADSAPDALEVLVLTGPNWVIRSNQLGLKELQDLQDNVGGDLLDLSLLQDSPPIPKGC